MKYSIKHLFHLVVAASVLVVVPACSGNQPKQKEAAAGEQQITTNDASPRKGKYALKSGIVEYKVEVMGMQTMQTLTFDDYGAKELSHTQLEMGGIKVNQYAVTKDEFTYTFDPAEKTGTKTIVAGASSIDFENLTDEIQKEIKIEKAGEETFLGRQCMKYNINNEKLKMNGWFLVWRGIVLKSDANMGGMKMAIEAVNVQENPAVAASVFDIPADITFNE